MMLLMNTSFEFSCKMLFLLLLVHSSNSAEILTIPSFNSPPVPRQFNRSCFDSVGNKLLLFGGFPEGGNNYFSDTWAFDYVKKTWTEITGTTSKVPSKSYLGERKGHACFIDELNRLFYIFGGESDLGVLNDMWRLSLKSYQVNATQWTEINQLGEIPPPVASFASTSYFVDGMQKFAICRGIEMDKSLEDVYRSGLVQL